MARVPDGFLKWDPVVLSQALHVNVEDVREYCTDGRRFSFIVERRIASEVLKGRMAPSEGASFDVFDPAGNKWEVRSVTNSGVYFCPSYMVGSQRSFEEAGFLAKLEEIRGYVLADLIRFPEIPFWCISADVVLTWWKNGLLGTSSKVNRRRALLLIDTSTKPD
jgi:hypothetical protein